jgi:hypothetical protein
MTNVTTSQRDSNAVGLRLYYDKVNGNGEIEWQKTYGASRFDLAHSIQQIQDGGYVGAGRTESYGAGNTDVWVLKLDANGNISGCQEGLIRKKGRTWFHQVLPFFELTKTHHSDRGTIA